MEDHKYMNLHRVRLRGGFAIESRAWRLGREKTRKSHFTRTDWEHDKRVFLSKPHVEAEEGHLLFSLIPSPAIQRCVLIESVGNPCGTDYTVEAGLIVYK